MKHIHQTFLLLSLVALLIGSACNDPTVIGSDLLAGDELDIGFTDTVTIRSYNMVEDSIITFNPDVFTNISSFPIGKMEDPVFGESSSAIYAQPTLNTQLPDFDEPQQMLDSVVLVLPFNARQSYGNLEETFSLEVYQMAETFPDTQLYSDMDFMVGDLIGTYEYVPAVNDSVTIDVPGQDSTESLIPQIRIPLDQNMFGSKLFGMDTTISTSVEEFENFVKGIYIKPVSTNKGIPSFRLRAVIAGDSKLNAGIRVYSHLDTTYSEYLFPFFSDNVVMARYEHDYSTSPLNLQQDFIGENAVYRDSLLFVQGMSGANFVIEVPYVESLSNKVLNKAELVFPIQFLPNDDPTIYLPIEQMVVSEIKDDGTRELIDDYLFAVAKDSDDFAEYFGGDQEADDTYRVNITSHLQDMSRGLVTKKMVVTLLFKAEQAARVVLNGTGHAATPAKLELTFTNF